MRRPLTLLLAVALAAAGCAGPADDGDGVATANGAVPSASAGAGTSTEDSGDGLKFARCMRANGLPWFKDPEPDQKGVRISIPPGQDKAEVDAAMDACRKYLPNGGEPPKLDAAALEQMRQMVKCMRENGVADFDSASGAEVVELLHDLHASGTTVLVITHDREIAASLPRQVPMRDGQVV